MITIRQLLEKKGHQVYSISPDATVYQALQMMADKDIGALLVIQEGKIVGMFSERDYARKVVLHGRHSKETSVGEMMVKGIHFIEPHRPIEDCMLLMTQKKVRHVPVISNNQLMGLVSIGDVVNNVISQQKGTIQDLENYIRGGYGQ